MTSLNTPRLTFFSSEFTGDGRKDAGLFRRSFRPINRTRFDITTPIEKRMTTDIGTVKAIYRPVAPISQQAFSGEGNFSIPGANAETALHVPVCSQEFLAVWFDMTPESVALFIESSGQSRTSASRQSRIRECVVSYRHELTVWRDNGNLHRSYIVTSPDQLISDKQSVTYVWWDTSPCDHAYEAIVDALTAIHLTPGAALKTNLDTWLSNYNVHDHLLDQVHAWTSSDISREMCQYITELPQNPTLDQLNRLAKQLCYLENYPVSLEDYDEIVKCIHATCAPEVAEVLCKQNLSLLMDHTLSGLNHRRHDLAIVSPPVSPVMVPNFLTDQQRAVVTTHEPLVMAQAGAGTGKSTVILERLRYMQSCGVPASDITVLSFTNAAADNIAAKNPTVGSMTIARMVMDIYVENYPAHRLSTSETIANMIAILYPTDNVAAMLAQRLSDVEALKNGAYARLNIFVENHFDEVIAILDRLGQTTLELQLVICYQRLGVLREPEHIRSRHLIIDEVQDNSVFEFIYILKYVTEHRQSLFIVGDASQTLYEFRAANPRALNALEMSGVFTTFTLTTNYRSNQEILDFANVTLSQLETNQFANIQLASSMNASSTSESFARTVYLDYHPVNKLTGFVESEVPDIFDDTVIPEYIEPRLARGEQVAFLAYSRKDMAVMRDTLTRAFPGKSVVSLVSDQVMSTTVFSRFVRHGWNEVLQAKPGDAAFVVSQGIRQRIPESTKGRLTPEIEQSILGLVSQWWTTNAGQINTWVELCRRNQLSHHDFFTQLRDNLIQFEIYHNQMKLTMVKRQNEERKHNIAAANAHFIVSTIHGVKGLEFPHTVILYKDTNELTSNQEMQRLFYVAFTRAMKSEYILAYGTQKKPAIVDKYNLIATSLESMEKGA